MNAAVVGAIGPVIAAAIVGTDRRIHRQLKTAAATTPAQAIALPTRSPLWRWRLRRLVGAGAVQVETSGLYYLDLVGWQRYRARRRLRAVSVIGVVLTVAAYLWWHGAFNGAAA